MERRKFLSFQLRKTTEKPLHPTNYQFQREDQPNIEIDLDSMFLFLFCIRMMTFIFLKLYLPIIISITFNRNNIRSYYHYTKHILNVDYRNGHALHSS